MFRHNQKKMKEADMYKAIEKLIKFSKKPANAEYMTIALDTFFEEIDDWMDSYYADEHEDPMVANLYEMVYPIALEYFFSANYDPDESGKYWNVIDRFLATKPIGLSSEETAFLNGLRNSQVGIYEVITVDSGSITFKNLSDNQVTTIRENRIYESTISGDVFAARVINLGSEFVFSGSGLKLSPKSTAEAMEAIKRKPELFSQALKIMESATEIEIPAIEHDYIKHISESLIARTITEIWLANDILELEEITEETTEA